jgi:signal transduction histidine kinase
MSVELGFSDGETGDGGSRRFTDSLIFRIGAVIVLAEIIVLAVVGVFYVNRFSDQVDQRIIARAQLPGSLMNAGLLNLDSVADGDTMQQLVGEEIVSAMVIGVNGNVFYSLDPQYLGLDVDEVPGVDSDLLDATDPELLTVRGDGTIVSVSPVFGIDPGAVRFFAYVEVGTSEAAAEKAEIARLFFFGSLAAVVITSVIVIVAFQRWLLPEIGAVLGVLRRIKAGDIGARVSGPFPKDEVGELQRGVNSMAQERQRAYEDLQRSGEALTASNRDLEKFATAAAHDLTEPLRKVQIFGGRLESALGDDLEAEAQRFLDRMLFAVRRMMRQVDGILEYSQIDSASGAFEPTALSDVVAGVVDGFEQRLIESGGRVDIGSLPTVDAVAEQMRMLFTNLIANSLDFARPDVAPVVSVSATIESIKGRAICRVVVADNGAGFDQQHADRLLAVFQRLAGPSESVGAGTGLAICRRIVERHRGTIEAHGVPEEGAQLEVRLPVHREEETLD